MRRPMRVAVPILFILFLTCMPVQAKIFYVKADATGNNDGSSWTDACTDLQPAMDAAVANTDDPEDEIWVAAGTYYPTVEHGNSTGFPDDRYKSFQMVNGIGIYGGFKGTESSLAQRVSDANVTILSGDLDQDKVLDDGNAYHVFYHPSSLGLDETAVLDGCVIKGGMANGDTPHNNGGGMYNQDASPTITKCRFMENAAAESGGGIYNSGASSPSITECIFDGNEAVKNGGGIFNGGTSSPVIDDCTFFENQAEYGGAMCVVNSSSTTVTGGSFNLNTAISGGGIFTTSSTLTLSGGTFYINQAKTGGGIYNSNASPVINACAFIENHVEINGGGIFNAESSPTITNCTFILNASNASGGGMGNMNCSPLIINCSFSGNKADHGGAMANDTLATPTIDNCILWGDTALVAGNEIWNTNSTPFISYSDIQDSGGSGSGWDSGLGEDRGGNINQDPEFAGTRNLHLAYDSPCINKGSTAAVPLGLTTDMDGENRINGVVDMGADEVVDTDGDGLVDRLEIAVYDTDPNNADTDDDSLSDYDEVTIYETDPNLSDSDHDDLLDGYEVHFAGTDPNKEDTDGDGYTDGQEVASGTDPLVAMGPGVPVLVYPETDATGIDLSVQLRVTYSEYGTSTTHTATRWQIAQDEAFTTLSADITSETDLLTLTVPDLVLNPETTYHWRVRFEASDGLERSWSGTGSFTTAAVADGDTNGNGLDDDQELAPGTTPAIVPGVETGWRNTVSTITFDAEDGVATQAALRLSDDGSSLVFFRQVPSADLAVACPSALDLGAFSLKIQVPAAGDSTSIRIYFSPSPLDEHSKVYKYDAENGWYDFSANAAISGDFTFITLQLTDGGAGDADGTANGVIVDPLGTSSVVPDNPSGSSGGGGGGGCFIGTTAD